MQKLTARLLMLALGLLCVSIGVGAQVHSAVNARFFAAGTSTTTNVVLARATFSRLNWVVEGPITACSFRMEESNDGTTWTDLIPLQDCSVSGKLESIHAPFVGKFVRYNVSTFTGSSSVVFFWDGFRGDACGISYRGIFTVITSPDPAAGAELSTTVPADERWRVYSSSFELQANSTVEDREVFLVVSQGSDEYFRTFADGVVKANQLGIFTSAPIGFVGTAGLGPSSINQPTDVRTIMIPIYSDAFVPGGHTLATDTGGLQAGDNYSPAVLLVERCPN